jgi:hypothetical protein
MCLPCCLRLCSQLFSMYVGEGEAMLRDVFARARLAAPAIVLLDEVDAVAGGSGSESGQWAYRQGVSQLIKCSQVMLFSLLCDPATHPPLCAWVPQLAGAGTAAVSQGVVRRGCAC